jgi:hypothetical protein
MKPFSLNDIRDQLSADLEGYVAVTRLNLEYYLTPGGSLADIEAAKLQVRALKFVATLVQAWGLAWLSEDMEILYGMAGACHESSPETAQEIVLQVCHGLPSWRKVGELTLAGDELEAIAAYREIRSIFEPMWESYLPVRRVPIKRKNPAALKLSLRQLIETSSLLLDKVPSLSLLKISEQLPVLHSQLGAYHLKGFEPIELSEPAVAAEQADSPSTEAAPPQEDPRPEPVPPAPLIPEATPLESIAPDPSAPPVLEPVSEPTQTPLPAPEEASAPKPQKQPTASSIFDEGYLALKQGLLALAGEKFRQALALEPDNRMLQHNLRVIEKKIAASSSGVLK